MWEKKRAIVPQEIVVVFSSKLDQTIWEDESGLNSIAPYNTHVPYDKNEVEKL